MSESQIRTLIESHITRYPEMRIGDVYKLLHQATFGSSEAVSKRKSTQEWLEHELEVNPPNPKEPLLENVSVDESIFRLHLRPYQAGGGQMKPLLEASIRSTGAVTGTAETMASRWAVFVAMADTSLFNPEHIPVREVHLFGKIFAGQRWAVTAHSPHFIRAYHPAYRILTAAEARKLVEGQGMKFSW
jgi:hypothetical protein